MAPLVLALVSSTCPDVRQAAVLNHPVTRSMFIGIPCRPTYFNAFPNAELTHLHPFSSDRLGRSDQHNLDAVPRPHCRWRSRRHLLHRMGVPDLCRRLAIQDCEKL